MKTYKLIASLGAIVAASGSTASAVAISLNLEGAGASGFINGAEFTNVNIGSTGTGVINSFVRVQDNGIADGYNATARPVMPDVNNSGQFTHDLLLSAVPLVTRSGINYYEFLLDINQQNSSPLLSLDMIQIYTRSTALTTANTLVALTGGPSVLRYNLDAGDAGNEIRLNYSLNSGSGSGDMFAYIPQTAFGSALGSDFVYLYSMFGAKGGAYEENDGFEEWAVRTPGTPPPPNRVPDGGATLVLLGLALSGLGIARRASSKA